MPEMLRAKRYPLLLRLSGEDPQIILRANEHVQRQFSLIGGAVLVIALCSLIGALLFFHELFDDSWWAPCVVSILWAVTMLNLYLLLLSTITPTNIRSRDHHDKKRRITETRSPLSRRISLGLRFLFMGLLGLLTAQPIQLFVVSLIEHNKMETYAEAKKSYLNARYELGRLPSIAKEEKAIARHAWQATSALYLRNDATNAAVGQMVRLAHADSTLAIAIAREVAKVDEHSPSSLLRQSSQLAALATKASEHMQLAIALGNAAVPNGTGAADLNQWAILAAKRQAEKDEWDDILSNDNFLVFRTEAAFKHSSLGWMLSAGFILLFVLPIRWKYSIRSSTDFYNLKEDIERRFIKDNYKDFKSWYQTIFEKHFGLSILFYETHSDPPFNLEKIAAPQLGQSQKELLSKLYAEDEANSQEKDFVSEKVEIL